MKKKQERLKKEERESKKNILKNGWIPGADFIIYKVILNCTVGIVCIYYGINFWLDAFISGQISLFAMDDAILLLKEVETNNNNSIVPPTLIKIMSTVRQVHKQEYAIYYLTVHKIELINILKKNPQVSTYNVEYINEIIDYINKKLEHGIEVGTFKTAYKTDEELEKIIKQELLEYKEQLKKK